MVDFEDKTQKDNFKWIENFLKYQKRKHPNEDNTSFMLDLMEIHIRCFSHYNQAKKSGGEM